MRASTLPSILFSAWLLILAGCGGQAEPGPASRREAERVRPLGRRLTQELQQGLRGELLGALEAGGPAGALEVCVARAQALSRELGEAASPRAELRRVSRRALNPANAPDSWDLQALELFESAEHGSGHLPEDWVLRLEHQGELRYRYYTPIQTGAPCLVCHGPGESLSDTLRQLLTQRFPSRQDAGFREGELQGLVCVEWLAEDLPKAKDRP